MPRRTFQWAAVCLAALPAVACSQARLPHGGGAEGTRLEAINLLQGLDTLPVLDTARISQVTRALEATRRQLPQLADITAGPDRSFLMLGPADSVADAFLARSGARAPWGANSDFWSAPVDETGFAAIDSLNRMFGVESVFARSAVGQGRFELHFRQPMNLPVVARAYRRVPQVQYAEPEIYVGGGSWIALIPKRGRLHLVFARGGGDCPSGCTEWDYYYVTYDTAARSVTLEQQRLTGTNWSDPISYWDVPTRYSINPYPTVDSLYAGLRSGRWWYRQHAVHVLGRLLGNDTGPWHGASEQSPALFAQLKAAALSHRRESYEALIGRLTDPDPDVAQLALAYLRQLSGRNFPGGADGVAPWREWLAQAK